MNVTRISKEKSTFNGLKLKLTSTDFVLNLHLLPYAITELSLEVLRFRIILRIRQILIFQSMSEKCCDGFFYKEAEEPECSLTFKNVQLHKKLNKNKINFNQFYQSLAANLKSRMLCSTSSHSSSTNTIK